MTSSGPTQDEGKRRDQQQRSHERQNGPYQNAVPRSHQQEGGHASTRHDERNGPEQDEQQSLGMHAIHAYFRSRCCN